jgi:pimeloyl-ACP methyl ester carboxylesterase
MSKSEQLGSLKTVKLPQGTISYREVGSGEPIVFIHGLLVNGDLWRKVVPELKAHYRCIVPDLPLGSHEVGMAAEADLTPPGVAKLIANFITALELPPVTLVGNDTGGAFCQLVIDQYPQLIERLVLTNCDAYQHFFPAQIRILQWGGYIPGFVWLNAKLFNLGIGTKLMLKTLAKYPVDDQTIRSYLRTGLADKAVRRDLGKILRGISNRYTLDAATRFGNFKKPVLLAWSPKDLYFSRKDAVRLSQDFPNARLEFIENSLTFVPEDQPQKLAELIEEFIAKSVASKIQV